MFNNDDLQVRWWTLEAKLVERFGKKPDMETILFLIGIQELGAVKEKFTKEQKQVNAYCHLPPLSPSGYSRKKWMKSWRIPSVKTYDRYEPYEQVFYKGSRIIIPKKRFLMMELLHKNIIDMAVFHGKKQNKDGLLLSQIAGLLQVFFMLLINFSFLLILPPFYCLLHER